MMWSYLAAVKTTNKEDNFSGVVLSNFLTIDKKYYTIVQDPFTLEVRSFPSEELRLLHDISSVRNIFKELYAKITFKQRVDFTPG